MRCALVVLCVGLQAQVGHAQEVPDGVYSAASGPVELCGLTAPDVAALRGEAERSTSLSHMPIDSDRFELFADADHAHQLVFTLPGEAAYPAASCRRVYEEDGSLRMERSLRCGAGRAECDALFLEFQELDASLTRELRGR